jgi:RNA polymerase sigma factor (sigma-70 family)
MIDEVVRRCQSGERSAFYELFRLHGGMIQKIAIRMTRNTEWQKDIFQDVVTQVFEKIEGFRGECKFTTWLYRITVNAALRFLQREEGPKKELLFDETIGCPENPGGGALGLLERKEALFSTTRVLSALPREQGEILSLFYFAEQSVEEIARQTGKSEGAVKAVLWKGRRAIVTTLKKQGLLKVL